MQGEGARQEEGKAGGAVRISYQDSKGRDRGKDRKSDVSRREVRKGKEGEKKEETRKNESKK